MLTSGTEEGQQCGALAIANIAANDSQNLFEIGECYPKPLNLNSKTLTLHPKTVSSQVSRRTWCWAS